MASQFDIHMLNIVFVGLRVVVVVCVMVVLCVIWRLLVRSMMTFFIVWCCWRDWVYTVGMRCDGC